MLLSHGQVWPEGIHGLELKVEGFSHKLPVLTKTVFEQLANFKVLPCTVRPWPVYACGYWCGMANSISGAMVCLVLA